jgi:putative molybdopterin biosynthesis protein
MTEFLTTRELARLLRVKERKIYDLVAAGALPVRRATGKLLFPRADIDKWITANAAGQAESSSASQPPVLAGGHDPLLEWALRDSRCGIAALMDGALDGLARMQQSACIAAGLHIPNPNGEDWNIAAVRKSFEGEPVVLLEWARRTRGLMYRSELGRTLRRFKDLADARFQSRQPEAGSELILAQLLEREGLKRSDLRLAPAVERSETDLAMAIAAGRADVGLGVEAAARQFQLEFAPMIVERFDLLISRKAYFDPPWQKFMRFCESAAFRERAAAYGGYDLNAFGAVRFNGP